MKITLNKITASIEALIKTGIPIKKYADPTEDAREDLSLEEAEEVAREDIGLLWVDSYDLNKLSFQDAQRLAAYEESVEIAHWQLEEWDASPEIFTLLTFGPHGQLWADCLLFWEGAPETLAIAAKV